jgi:hypothetical protein
METINMASMTMETILRNERTWVLRESTVAGSLRYASGRRANAARPALQPRPPPAGPAQTVAM